MNEDERPKLEPMYTPDDMAELLQFSKSKVYELMKKEGWPHLRLGVQIRFTLAQIEEIITRHTRTPEQQQRRPRIGTRARKTR